jgi:pyruvate dehydrogenase (quinone)
LRSVATGKCWRRAWAALALRRTFPAKVVIVKNNTLGQIKWEQMVFLSNPEYRCDLQPIDTRPIRARLRWHRLHHRGSRSCRAVLEQALATPGPVIVEAVVDPFEPPLPAKITLEQAKQFATSLIREGRTGDASP